MEEGGAGLSVEVSLEICDVPSNDVSISVGKNEIRNPKVADQMSNESGGDKKIGQGECHLRCQVTF